MAKELRRTFDAALGAVVVEIEDDFGARSVHTIHVSHDHELCPACGQRLKRGSDGEVDVEGAIASLLSGTNERTDRLAATFEKHGANMKAVNERRAQRAGETGQPR